MSVLNPLFYRYCHQYLRRPQLLMYTAIYAIVVVLIISFNRTIGTFKHIQSLHADVVFLHIHNQLLVLQVIISVFLSAYGSGRALHEELMEKTAEFFRLLPLSVTSRVIGIIIGRNMFLHAIGLVNIVLIMLFGLLGDVAFAATLRVLLLILSVAVFANMLTLFSSTRARKLNQRSTMLTMLLLGITLWSVLQGMAFSGFAYLINRSILLFGWSLPLGEFVVLICLYLAVWLYFGLRRDFVTEGQTVFSGLGGLFFLGGGLLLLEGTLLPNIRENLDPAVGWFKGPAHINVTIALLSTIALTYVVLLGSIQGNYHERLLKVVGNGQKDSPRRSLLGRVLLRNFLRAAGCFILWLVLNAVVQVSYGMETKTLLGMLPHLLSFYLVTILSHELIIIYKAKISRFEILGVFLFLCYLFVPLIAMALKLGYKHPWRCYSPLGFFITMFQSLDNLATFDPGALIYNLVLVVAMLGLVAREYREALRKVS